jgi:hypothetical protein
MKQVATEAVVRSALRCCVGLLPLAQLRHLEGENQGFTGIFLPTLAPHFIH